MCTFIQRLKNTQNNKGVALVVTICTMFLFTVFGLILILTATNFSSSTTNESAKQQSYIGAKTFMEVLDRELTNPASELSFNIFKEYDGRYDGWIDDEVNGRYYAESVSPSSSQFYSIWQKGDERQADGDDITLSGITNTNDLNRLGKFKVTLKRYSNSENPNVDNGEVVLAVVVKCSYANQSYIITKYYSPKVEITDLTVDETTTTIYVWNGWKAERVS